MKDGVEEKRKEKKKERKKIKKNKKKKKTISSWISTPKRYVVIEMKLLFDR